MKCGGTCTACGDHQKCLKGIESILSPVHRGSILAPTCPKAMPVHPGRDVREGGAGEDQEEHVSMVDGLPFSPKHLADMEKTMHVI